MNLVYVLHFVDSATGAPASVADHAAHYVGFCGRGLPSRLAYHRRGAGSRLVRALVERGSDFVVALVLLDGSRDLERLLKRRKSTPRFCPVCRDDARVYRSSSGRLFVRFRPRRRAAYERRLRSSPESS